MVGRLAIRLRIRHVRARKTAHVLRPLSDPPTAHSLRQPLRPGQGILELEMVAGRTVATRAAATTPLKLLLPRRPGPAAWVYSSTYGGGLVAGDEIDLCVRLHPETRAVLSTQSATKVYKSPQGRVSRQTLDATIDDGALLVVAPDPVSCFRGARYEQRQQISVSNNGAVVVVDWFTSGRRARGEQWSMNQYRSRLDIYHDGEHALADAWLLDPRDGPLTSPYRFGQFHCAALVAIVGRCMEPAASRLLVATGREPICSSSEIWMAGSPIPRGAILRILGKTPEQVGRRLAESLSFLSELLGVLPWDRKW